MTANTTEVTSPPTSKRSAIWKLLDKLPGANFLKNQKIGVRLSIGFGVMVLLTFLVAGIGFFWQCCRYRGNQQHY